MCTRLPAGASSVYQAVSPPTSIFHSLPEVITVSPAAFSFLATSALISAILVSTSGSCDSSFFMFLITLLDVLELLDFPLAVVELLTAFEVLAHFSAISSKVRVLLARVQVFFAGSFGYCTISVILCRSLVPVAGSIRVIVSPRSYSHRLYSVEMFARSTTFALYDTYGLAMSFSFAMASSKRLSASLYPSARQIARLCLLL